MRVSFVRVADCRCGLRAEPRGTHHVARDAVAVSAGAVLRSDEAVARAVVREIETRHTLDVVRCPGVQELVERSGRSPDSQDHRRDNARCARSEKPEHEDP